MEHLTTARASPILISNAQVRDMLRQTLAMRKDEMKKQKRRRKDTKYAHRDWIEKSVHEYLQCTPCTKLDIKKHDEMKYKLMSSKSIQKTKQKKKPEAQKTIAKDNDAKIKREGDDDNDADDAVQQKQEEEEEITPAEPIGFNLTEAESIQILNFLPQEPVEIHLMIEELQGRMSEQRQEELLEFIKSYSTEAAPMPVILPTVAPAAAEDDGMMQVENLEEFMKEDPDRLPPHIKQEL